ncbi:MAG: PQQ-binding-like beta-propeller repeat protein [Sedimentisphaerales bacterium]|jgi:outer membrane protein assembly factor BamB
MVTKVLVSLILVCSVAASVQASPEEWLAYANTMSRESIAVDGPNTLDGSTLDWVADKDPQDMNFLVDLENATGPVVYNGRVYAYAKYYNESSEYTNSQVIAYDANSGHALWATVIDQAVWDSWSTPCIDTKHNTVLIGSGDKVFSLDAQSGTQLWTAQLEKDVINASVCAVVDIPHARAFITDYDGFGSTGKLYCINLDASEPDNPYEPGQIIWSETIGATSGNTPSYRNGVIYVSSINGPGNSTGTIYAYDATAAPAAIKKWETTDANFDGFSGGVVVTKEGFLYAAAYDWANESEDNSTLCKLDCNDGSIIWITQTERTSSIPVVVGDKIYTCGGFVGWGSRPKVEAYQDNGDTVIKLWETGSDIAIGGWSNQPVYANGKLYVGAIPTSGNYFGEYTEVYILNVSTEPNDINFIIAHYTDKSCGNSPAVTYDSIYTIGYDGLFKFRQPEFLGDINRNRKVDIYDFDEFAESWLFNGPVGVKRADLDLDGDVDFTDFALFANEWEKDLSEI